MTRRSLLVVKVVVWGACLTPLVLLVSWIAQDDVTANPISFITNWLGDWTLRILLTSLALTPLRLVTGMAWQMPLRRLLGLFAFFYVCLHFTVWIGVDHFFAWRQMGADIVKRPYITVGMTALLSLVPLAATSTTGMIKRLGGLRWRRLHRLAYVAAILGVLHFVWLAKVGRVEPYYYMAVLALLLGIRLWYAARRLARRAAGGARSDSMTSVREGSR